MMISPELWYDCVYNIQFPRLTFYKHELNKYTNWPKGLYDAHAQVLSYFISSNDTLDIYVYDLCRLLVHHSIVHILF